MVDAIEAALPAIEASLPASAHIALMNDNSVPIRAAIADVQFMFAAVIGMPMLIGIIKKNAIMMIEVALQQKQAAQASAARIQSSRAAGTRP